MVTGFRLILGDMGRETRLVRLSKSVIPNLKRRTSRLAKELLKEGLEGVIIAPGPNLRYYTGVSAHLYERPFLFFVQSDGDSHLLAPRLEAGPFRATIPMKIHAWTDNQGPVEALKEVLGEVNAKGAWGAEGRVPFGFVYHLLAKGLKVRPAEGVLQSIREVKEPEELELLRRSASILSVSMLKAPEALREGMTEKELSRFISEETLSRGADEVEPTVQSGARAADPHSVTSTRKIGRGESVVADVVSSYAGYAADITRTFVRGRDGEVERTYRSVLAAQERAIDVVRAGVTTGRVDAAARDSLKKDGLGKYFIHRTGHGLGLEVHEAPFIVARGQERLRDGMVFTVEPGAYVQGKLGVRIEDDVSISQGGRAEVITAKVPKEFGWWK
jgi:Xaa-Pro dipeptidase